MSFFDVLLFLHDFCPSILFQSKNETPKLDFQKNAHNCIIHVMFLFCGFCGLFTFPVFSIKQMKPKNSIYKTKCT